MSDQFSQSTMSTLQTQKAWTYFIWIYFALAGIFFFLLDARNLPDYEAYAGIFISPGYIKEPGFIFLNDLIRNVGFTYNQYRSLLLLFDLSAFYYLIRSVLVGDCSKRALPIILNAILLSYFFSVFILEFFVIRLRAGLAIALFCLAIGVLIRRSNTKTSYLVAVALIGISFSVHLSTSVILFTIFCATLIPKVKIYYLKNMFGLKVLIFIFSVVTFFLIYLVLTQNQIRSGVVVSPLNPVRLIFLAIVPVVIYFYSLILESDSSLTGSNMDSWPEIFELFYVILSIGLIGLYLLGLTLVSGESLVRFSTLLSFPALIAFLISKESPRRIHICAYIIFMNASFFLATLNMLPGSILEILRLFGKS